MYNKHFIKKTAVLVILFFSFFMFQSNFSYANTEKEDTLDKAKLLISKGNITDAISELSRFIDKLKNIETKNKKVAEAHYLLARVYYKVMEDKKFEENIKIAFKLYPNLDMNETDFEIKEKVQKIKESMKLDSVPIKETKKEAIKKKVEEKEKTKQVEKKEETKVKKEIKKKDKVKTKKVIVKKGKKKKKKFPTLLVVGGVVLVAVLAILLLKKKSDDKKSDEYDIRGDWEIKQITIDENGNELGWTLDRITFSGTSSSGTGNFIDNPYNHLFSITYSVNGSSVTFTVNYNYSEVITIFNGAFINKDKMSGNWNQTSSDYAVSGPWEATRIN